MPFVGGSIGNGHEPTMEDYVTLCPAGMSNKEHSPQFFSLPRKRKPAACSHTAAGTLEVSPGRRGKRA
jgi:hypothetical protein